MFFAGNSQKPIFTWGEESPKMIVNDLFYVAENPSEPIQVRFISDKRFTTGAHGSKATPHITRFDKKMQVSIEHDLAEMDKNSAFMGITRFGDKIYFFSNTLSDHDKTITYYAQAINAKLLSPEGEKKILASFDYLPESNYFKNPMFGNGERRFGSGGTLALSPDSSKLLLVSRFPSQEKSTDNFRVLVFDKDLKKSWDKTIQIPTPSEFTFCTHIYATNNGQAIIALREYSKKINSFDVYWDLFNPQENVVKLLVCDKDAATKVQSFNIGNKSIHSLSIDADAKGSPQIFALYQTNLEGNINGYFRIPFDHLKQGNYNPELVPFPQKICEQVLLDGQANKKDENAGIGLEFFINKVLNTDDGSSHYLLEYHLFHNSLNTRGTGGATGVQYSVSGDILDINYAAGKSSAVFRIPKREKNAQSGRMNATTWNNKIVLLDYTFESSLSQNANDELDTKGRGGEGDHVGIMTVLNEKGDFKKSIVYRETDDDFTPSFGIGSWVTNNRMVINSFTSLRVYTQKIKTGMLEIK